MPRVTLQNLLKTKKRGILAQSCILASQNPYHTVKALLAGQRVKRSQSGRLRLVHLEGKLSSVDSEHPY